MKKNIDLENSSYTDLKSILSKLTWKSWGLLLGICSLLITTLITIGFIDFPWIGNLKNRENSTTKIQEDSSTLDKLYSARILPGGYQVNKVFFKGGYLHVDSSTIQSCINDYKNSFNEVGAEIQIEKLGSVEYSPNIITAILNGHVIYGYCYITTSNKVNSYAVLFADGIGATNSEAKKAANLAGVNLDSVISHLKGVQPL